jgi:hypothetical protein
MKKIVTAILASLILANFAFAEDGQNFLDKPALKLDFPFFHS